MNKVCVIGVYFGKLPNYFPLWMRSARSNKDVDFLIVGDNRLPDEQNIKFYYIEFVDFQKKLESFLGYKPALEKPYKCCDFRPLYGELFAENLIGYDYWGHCDFDVIFGDLTFFFQQEKLDDYDKFLTLGHLSLYKNTTQVNERYKIKNKYMSATQVFTSNCHYTFDEIPGMGQTYLENGWTLFTKRIFADITPIYKRFRMSEYYFLDEKVKNYKHQIFYWEKGKVYRAYIKNGELQKEEYLYIHFQKRPNFEITPELLTVDGFYITKDGFFVKEQEVTQADIDKYNRYKGALYEWWEKTKFSIKRFFTKVKNRLKRLKR